MGRSYANIQPSLRGIPLDSHIILYRERDSKVEIVRVVSGYRDLNSLFDNSSDE